MIQISYAIMVLAISIIWVFVRLIFCLKNKKINWKREIQLLFVYICIIVVARFTFFPFGKIDGKIQLLVFDAAKMIPFRMNVVPFVHLFDYAISGEATLNIIGNTAMFIPIGVIWPVVYKELNTHVKIMAAGIGFSVCIEILQLPFFDRVTDIDDLILNSLGFLIGYVCYILVLKIFLKKQVPAPF